MRTYLVTGGAGFIGGHLVRQLIAEPSIRVVNLDKLTYAADPQSVEALVSEPRHVFVKGDIGDMALVGQLLDKYRPQAVIHLAAESHVDRSIDSPEAFIETNVVGTCRLLQAARQYWNGLRGQEQSEFRFLQVSTDEVYGSLGPTGAFDESSPYRPNSPYSASKAAADHFARAYCHTYGLPVFLTNCSNNYGPHQFPEKLIPLMILNALEGRPLPVYGDGQNVRDWLFVSDHCAALLAVLERGTAGEVYNIGGNCQRTNLQVVESICQAVDTLRPDLPHHPCSKLIEFVPDRPGHDRRYAIDSTKIQRELGWSARHDFDSGLALTVEWYLAHPEWVERIEAGNYRRERLGLERKTHTR